MARRSRRPIYSNPTLGVREPTASEYNEAASQRELAHNKAAATQYSRMVQGDILEEDFTRADNESTEAARIALAKALGHDPQNAPPFAAMMARYYSVPKNVQAGIYKQGGAQFIDGKTGAKLLQSTAEDQEKTLDSHTNAIGGLVATGKINYEMDKEGKPAFFSVQDDETDPLGQKKKKVPLNGMQLALLDRGFRKGIIPNPFNPDANNGALPTPPKKMSTEEFQKVLDARAAMDGQQPATTPQLEASLNTAPTSIPLPGDPNANRANMSLSPYNYGSNMSLTPYAYDNNLQFNDSAVPLPRTAPTDTPMTSALRAREMVREIPNRIVESNILPDIYNAAAQTYGKDLPRSMAGVGDWITEFATGRPVTPLPESDFGPDAVPARLGPMDAVYAEMERERRLKARAQQVEANPLHNADWGF